MKSLGKNQIVVSSFSSPKLVNFFLTGAGVTVKNLNFLGLIFGKGKLLNEKLLQKLSFSDTEGPWKVWAKWIVLSHFFPPKIGEFLSSGPEGGIFKPWQEFYFVTLTLKSHANFGITLNAAFHISLPKIGQFLLTRWKGSKFEILLLSFVWKENWLNQKTITGVLFCDTEEPCKLWDNTECCFPYNIPQKYWSIYFDRVKRIQIWDFISLFSLKGKLLKPKNLDRSFILWHWRAMESMEENRILLFKSVHQSPPPLHPPPLPTKKKKLINSFLAEEKCPNFKFYCLILYEKKIAWTKKPSQGFYLVTLKSCGKFRPKLNADFQISTPKIGQFVSSCRKGYKFQLLVVSFLSKVHYLNQKL